MEPPVAFVSDDGHAEYARVAAAHGLEEIAASDPACREPVGRALVDVLGRCSEDHPSLNGFLVSYLIDLRAIEHADLAKRAYDEGVVDEMVCGSWPWVAFERARRSSSRPSSARTQPAQQRTAKKVDKKSDKAARKRQKQARKKNRRR